MEEIIQKQKKRFKIFAIGSLALFAIAYIATIAITNPNFFRGEVLNILREKQETTGAGEIFIPKNYLAQPGTVGEIEIKTKEAISINGIQFTLKFNKTQISAREIVTENTPLRSFISDINTETPEGAIVVLANANAVDVAANEAITKIKISINQSVTDGTQIPISITDIKIIKGDLTESIPTTEDGSITIQGDAIQSDEVIIESISPTALKTSESTDLVIKGENFNNAEVFLDSQKLAIRSRSATEIVAIIADGLLPRTYRISVVNADGKTTTVENAIVISEEFSSELRIVKEQSQMIPPQIPNDGRTFGELFVTIEDTQGVDDVDTVNVDLTPINGSPTNLMQLVGNKNSLAIYKLNIVAPRTVSTSDTPYKLPITVRNRSGQIAEEVVEITVSNKVLSSIAPTVIQANASPDEGIAGKKVSFFVEVEDKDGIDDIKSVVLNLIEFGSGFGPVSLKKLDFNTEDTSIPVPSEISEEDLISTPPEEVEDIFSASQDAGFLPITQRQWYVLRDVTLPAEIESKTYNLDLEITDQSDERTTSNIRFKVLSPDEIAKFAPQVITEDSYTTPLAAINDEETPVTLFTTIEHKNPLQSVIVDLGNIGFVVDPQTQTFQAPATNQEVIPNDAFAAQIFDTPEIQQGNISTTSTPQSTCPTNSDIIVCMNITAQIGSQKTIASLPNVVIRKQVSPSSDPYLVKVIATDTQGQVSEGYIPVIVHDGKKFTSDDVAPKVLLATSTTPENIEILFSEPLRPESIVPSGRDFNITFEDDIQIRLPVLAATINASGTIVTLTTAPQEEGRFYAVEVGTAITDAIGIPIVRDGQNKARFVGFIADSIAPRLDFITPLSPTQVELEFHKPLRPSTIELSFLGPDGVDQASIVGTNFTRKGSSNFRIRDAVEGEDLAINAVYFGRDANVIILETETQTANQKYFVNAREIASYSGVFVKKSGLTQFFKGFQKNIADVAQIRNSADFNQDGKVDFGDFTVFATFYGKTVSEIGEGGSVNIEQPQNNQSTTQEQNNTTPGAGAGEIPTITPPDAPLPPNDILQPIEENPTQNTPPSISF